MKPKKRERFAPKGVLAILPSAHGEIYDTLIEENPGDVSALEGKDEAPPLIPVVQIHGPLEHHGSWMFASYDAIKCQVAYALQASEAPFIILDIDSPGGLVSGCFDTSREIRVMADKAGKRLIAFVNGMACSAAYSLACAADEIVVGQTSMVGSIGVIDCMVDVTANDEANGVKFAVITSGARKADGNPHTPISAQALAIAQQRVDELAQIFFGWVSERRGLSVEEVQGLQAGISYGEKAVSLKLADSVSTLDQLVERLMSPQSSQENSEMKASYKDAKKALESVAADANASEDEKASAKKMLAAIADDDKDEKKSESEEDEKKSEADEDKKKDEDKDEKKSDFGDDKKKDDDKDEKKSIAAVAASVARIEAKFEAAANAAKVSKLLAARPDLTPAQAAVFKGFDANTLAVVLAATPIASKSVEGAKPAAVSPMRASLAAVNGSAAVTDTEKNPIADVKRAAQRRRMGLGEPAKASVTHTGHSTVFDLAANHTELDSQIAIAKRAGEFEKGNS